VSFSNSATNRWPQALESRAINMAGGAADEVDLQNLLEPGDHRKTAKPLSPTRMSCALNSAARSWSRANSEMPKDLGPRR